MPFSFISKNKSLWIYGASLAALVFLLKWLELRFLLYDHALDAYIGAIAMIFTLLGIWLALTLSRPKVEIIVREKEVYLDTRTEFLVNEKALQQLGMSRRELEVLQLIAQGHSNQEIANRLFVSLNTIKTHNARIFEKMDVNSRTKAIEQAKRLGLIA